LRKNTIFANEAFPFSEENLIQKYILLHEEGHFKSFNIRLVLKYNVLLIFIVCLLLIAPVIVPSLFVIFQVLTFIIIFTFGIRSFARTGEIKSDIYAAFCLKKNYHISNPSTILTQTSIFSLKEIKPIRMRNRGENIPIKKKIIHLFERFYVNTHPTLEKRIAIVKNEVEEKDDIYYFRTKF
jgi:Zn-dependent protease with chaperone function